LSVEAVHPREMEVGVAPVCASPVGGVGGVVSGQALVAPVVVVWAETFPAASKASTPRVYVVPQVRPEYV
jgi:hypothetical protein